MPDVNKCWSCEYMVDEGICEKHGNIEDINQRACGDYEKNPIACCASEDPWHFSFC